MPFFLSSPQLLVLGQIPIAPSSLLFIHRSLLFPVKSLGEFFSRARVRGSETNKDIINEEEVRREVKPGTKHAYSRALAR